MAKQHFTTEELEQEIWKPVPDYPGYEVSDLGRVRSWRNRGHAAVHNIPPSKPYLLRCTADSRQGYHRAKLFKNYKPRLIPVHWIVLAAFVGPCPPRMICLHNDDDRDNNRLENLRYGSRIDNWADARKNGRACIGEKSGRSKLTNDEVIAIRVLYAKKFSAKSIAKAFGVDPMQVWFIATGKNWKHIGGPISTDTRADRYHDFDLSDAWDNLE